MASLPPEILKEDHHTPDEMHVETERTEETVSGEEKVEVQANESNDDERKKNFSPEVDTCRTALDDERPKRRR